MMSQHTPPWIAHILPEQHTPPGQHTLPLDNTHPSWTAHPQTGYPCGQHTSWTAHLLDSTHPPGQHASPWTAHTPGQQSSSLDSTHPPGQYTSWTEHTLWTVHTSWTAHLPDSTHPLGQHSSPWAVRILLDMLSCFWTAHPQTDFTPLDFKFCFGYIRHFSM